jgi:hypothetical protein
MEILIIKAYNNFLYLIFWLYEKINNKIKILIKYRVPKKNFQKSKKTPQKFNFSNFQKKKYKKKIYKISQKSKKIFEYNL